MDINSIFTSTLEEIRGAFNDKYISEIEKDKIKMQTYKPAPQTDSPQSPVLAGVNFKTLALIGVVGILAILAIKEVL